jgi:hypothetical protein
VIAVKGSDELDWEEEKEKKKEQEKEKNSSRGYSLSSHTPFLLINVLPLLLVFQSDLLQ